MKNLNRIVYIALLTATATIIGIIESSFPSPFAFAPGAKFGFANLVILMAIFTLKKSEVGLLLLLKLLLTALFTGFSVFLYSATGGLLSLLAMYAIKAFGPRWVSLIGISLVGGFFHNVGQLLMATVIAKTPSVLLYLPWLAFFGLLAGFFIGIAGNSLLYRIKPIHTLFIKENKIWITK
ncbi:heptaprenyl diphosphate synthase subunit I [Lactococcus hodotermopsidis]|uniref:Heptaprenyl diphosphate synthase subunit I n=1 Tax=Pseudolactococcus hodotermopsidis TaxID=2709157 RepID=A0A6A0BCP9_9LACT|nr:Gx transporter family protein [Lactococcus hodotermopsidis]GFH43199.1 heptaprenyl diphosphate synthase subunit I [Lactococcus hodotermopsidis]